MELPNNHFSDYPIDYKQLNTEEFSMLFKTKKTILDLEGETYLNDVLQREIRLHEKNTVVINTQVGKGKSYAIIQTIKGFYEAKENYLIFVASPFVSLVEQYCKSIEEHAGITKDDIYNYNNIGRSTETYLDKKIHVITANTLLGNPGDDGYKNSDEKREYLKALQEHCEKKDIKVVFIYDEIHDTIHNFKEEFIFNLWNWRKVTHKNFVISATFSEASKVVVEYLAELTNRKIQIIESEREKDEKNNSKLILHYSSVYHFTNETPEIRDTILDIIKRGKNIDILTYSKKIAKAIISDVEISTKVTEKFGVINDCTSENIDNQRPENKPPENRFDNSKSNIGTNFKSGISIEKENHAFVIVLPSRSTQSSFKNKYGIFSSGITSIVQALARKRKKGEIHIILPRPDEFNYKSLKAHFSEVQLKYFQTWYSKIQNYNTEIMDNEKVDYTPLKFQSWFLGKFYNEILKKDIQDSINTANELDRGDLARLDYPPYKNFVLSRGENYLAQKFKFWGGDLSAYLTYCAFTNQFVNCTLSEINYKTILIFKEGEIQKTFDKYAKIYFNEYYMDSLIGFSNFNLAYKKFREKIFGEFTLKYKKNGKEQLETISPYNNPKFEKQLLRYMAYQYYGKTYQDQDFIINRLNYDIDYTRSQYFLDSISCSLGLDANNSSFDDVQKEKILAFQNLNYFRLLLQSKIRQHSWGSSTYNYLPVKPNNDFITHEDLPKFTQLTHYFRNTDSLVKNGVFEFMRDFSNVSKEKRLKSFNKILIDDFFNSQSKKITLEGDRINVKSIDSLKELPNPAKTINLIDNPDKIFPEGYIDELTKFTTTEYGSLENFHKILFDVINNK